MFDLSTTINSLSRSSIYFSYWIISLFIRSIFCYLNLNCSFLSCSCFFKHCFRKQKSHDLSLLILFLEHSPHTDTAQIRLFLTRNFTNDVYLRFFEGWKAVYKYYTFKHWQIIIDLSFLYQEHYQYRVLK